VKDESQRLGLPAFKILGASWATYRLLCQRLGQEPGAWATVDDLRKTFSPLQPLTLVTATDGNHGRAVARAARWFGCQAHIFVPTGTAPARIGGIESEGATVELVDGTYDDAVERAAAMAGERTIVVSDTAWPGYTEIPGRVAEGYETICSEVDARLASTGVAAVTHVFVQVGVGALAMAIVRHYAPTARVIGLEPDGAACCYESVTAGEPVTVPGPHTSIMAGMNCGTVSLVAWPELRDGLDAVMTLDDDTARDAMRRLADARIVSGETGAAGVAAVLELTTNPAHRSVREALHLGSGSRVLALSTEGATDPPNYARVVGRSAEAVAAG
jgi:diaminopropionate ammonia-lyase